MSRARFHRLPDLGVIRLEGPDAPGFLQGQVTADLRLLEPGQAAQAAWCSPQGRVIALLRLLRLEGGLLCVLPRELTADVAARLARFVMRAKVSISDESGVLAVAGVSGTPAALPASAADLDVLPLPAERALVVAPAARIESALAVEPAEPAAAWEAACIRLGEPEVYVSTSESWVPQMLNLDLLGAVSFRKGCYPGQEIVARTQNLGRIKRRLFRYRASGNELPAPGDVLLLGEAKVGEVVRSARHDDAAELLAVVNLDAAGVGLTAPRAAAACSPEPLPYAVPEAPEAP
jgi:folate-binding protein YgfZ